jgi:hypothetical protein
MKLILIILFSSFFYNATANNISFVVYYAKGKTVKAGSTTWLKKGDHLFPKDILTLKDAANLVLVCNNYKIIQLNKKGNYTVANLMMQCAKSSASYSRAYFEYVWYELTHTKGTPQKKPSDFMKNVGAVSRGCSDVWFGLQADSLQMGPNSQLKITFTTFYNNATVALYTEEYDGSPIRKLPLKGSDSIDMGKLLSSVAPGIYYWQVVAEDGSSCERKIISVWSAKAYEKRMTFLWKAVPRTKPAETAFAKAFLLHENKYNAAALYWYQRAVQLNPKQPIYQQALLNFYETKQ